MANEQISLPYLAVIIIVCALVVRYLFFSPSTPPVPSHVRNANALRNREIAVERIQQMFPQADRRNILWDLQRNGGSIQLTSERILSGRLERPPITFQPPPPMSSQAAAGQSARPVQAKQAERRSQPDLITRYNLQAKIHGGEEGEEKEPETKLKGWSSSRDERQALLQRRRDEMILAARRKMQAKMAAEES